VCENPYKFTCGNFINQYKSHELYLVNKGEWGANSHFEYEGLYELLVFKRSRDGHGEEIGLNFAEVEIFG